MTPMTRLRHTPSPSAMEAKRLGSYAGIGFSTRDVLALLFRGKRAH